jgi:hypothetical protein
MCPLDEEKSPKVNWYSFVKVRHWCLFWTAALFTILIGSQATSESYWPLGWWSRERSTVDGVERS